MSPLVLLGVVLACFALQPGLARRTARGADSDAFFIGLDLQRVDGAPTFGGLRRASRPVASRGAVSEDSVS